MYSKFQYKILCLKTAGMGKVEFEGVPSSRDLQGSNHTEVLFGCYWFNLHLCSFESSILWEGDSTGIFRMQE